MLPKLLFTLCCLILTSTPVWALALKKDAPTQYVVQQGDTLWGIADRFLQKPWQWHALWYGNPHIGNPNQLHPGAVIRLHRLGRNPYLEYVAQQRKLTPRSHRQHWTKAIPPLALEDIRPFINSSLVLSEHSLTHAGKVVAFAREHIVGGNTRHIFVEHLKHQNQRHFSIYRYRGPYTDPSKKRILGHAAEHIADAKLIRPGEPATLVLTKTLHTVKPGDLVRLRGPEAFTTDFIPHAPKKRVLAHIISFFNNLTQAGNHQALVIDQGACEGIQRGDVLSIVAPGKLLVSRRKQKSLHLPDEHIGEVMVFRTFMHVSFAVIMRARYPVKRFDSVVTPI